MEVWMGYLHDLTTRLRQFRAAHEVRRHMERAHRPSHVHEANTPTRYTATLRTAAPARSNRQTAHRRVPLTGGAKKSAWDQVGPNLAWLLWAPL